MKYSKILAGLAIIGALSSSASAQTLYSGAGTTITQNFDGPGQALGNYTWTDNGTFTGWYAYYAATGVPATYRASNSPVSGANLYLLRSNATATDFALGSYPQDSTGAVMYAWRITNTTGTTLTSFTLSYTGEQWLQSSSGVNNTIVVSYYIGTPTNIGVADTFTDIPDLTFNTPKPIGTGTNVTLNGNLSENSVVLNSVTISNLSWAAGTDIWIRFTDSNSANLDHGIGIDDVTFSATSASAVPEPSTYAALAGAIGLIAAIGMRRRSKSAAR